MDKVKTVKNDPNKNYAMYEQDRIAKEKARRKSESNAPRWEGWKDTRRDDQLAEAWSDLAAMTAQRDELLAALRAAVTAHEEQYDAAEWMEAAAKAIAKAEGK